MSSLWVWPFELEEKLGEGGMGVVYRGRYVKNNRRVAVKLLPAEVADEVILARFEREVEVLRTLRHPNIVHSFGGVCEDKRRFYAMELVEGGTLEDLVNKRGGRIPWEEAVEYGLQMCSALAYAHERGVVHRDIKPGNFLLSRTGKLKLSDFGLATIAAGSRLTGAGRTMGTVRYIAPEQIRGRPAPSPQTDLYALGCVLFRIIAGRTPFEGDAPAELLNQHLHNQPPRIAQFAPDCPAALDHLIGRLLAKDPAQRPNSAADVADALRSVGHASLLGAETVAVSRPSSASVTAETLRPRPAGISLPNWLATAAAVVFVGLIAWNIWLHIDRGRTRAETLWIETYRDSSKPPAARIEAAKALGELGASSDAAVDALIAGLESNELDSHLRAESVAALARAGGNARGALGLLYRLQRQETDNQVRGRVNEALSTIRSSRERTSTATYLAIAGLVGLAGCGGYYLLRRLARDQAAGA